MPTNSLSVFDHFVGLAFKGLNAHAIYEHCQNCNLITAFNRQCCSLSYNTMKTILTIPAPCISKSCIKLKINLNFYFHISLWYLKRFYESL